MVAFFFSVLASDYISRCISESFSNFIQYANFKNVVQAKDLLNLVILIEFGSIKMYSQSDAIQRLRMIREHFTDYHPRKEFPYLPSEERARYYRTSNKLGLTQSQMVDLIHRSLRRWYTLWVYTIRPYNMKRRIIHFKYDISKTWHIDGIWCYWAFVTYL